MIRSLLYVTASRPDAMFSVCMCARFQASPRESHLKATNIILRYSKNTQNVRLWYPKGARFELIGYSNSDYAGCKVVSKCTSGTCQLLGRSLVSWSSKKQNSVALSTVEAEYISVDSFCAQLLWMKTTLNHFGIKFKQVPLLCDNESAVKLTNNPVQHSKTKHIDVYHHFIRDHQQKGDICIKSVGTNELNILDFSNVLMHLHLYDMSLLRAKCNILVFRGTKNTNFLKFSLQTCKACRCRSNVRQTHEQIIAFI
jgi:hypothetical protein